MKNEASSFDIDSANGPEVEFAGGIKIEAANDIPSVIIAGADGTYGKEELNKKLKDKSLDSDTNGINIHEVEAMLLEIMTDNSIPIEGYNRLLQWAKAMTKFNNDASNPTGYHKIMRKITNSAPYAHNMLEPESITIRHLSSVTVYKIPFLKTSRDYIQMKC
eukprot:671968-Ditylum_brightwellii.AAC.1